MLTVSYKGAEFFRIGYYVYNNYIDPELLENTPEKVIIEKVHRNILADKPRITRFEIEWEKQPEETIPLQLLDENSLSILSDPRESLSFKEAVLLSGQNTISHHEYLQEKPTAMCDNPFLEEASNSTSGYCSNM